MSHDPSSIPAGRAIGDPIGDSVVRPVSGPSGRTIGNVIRIIVVLSMGSMGGAALNAATPANPAASATVASHVAVAEVGPHWTELSSAQRGMIGPLEREWPRMDVRSKQKWLEVADRLPKVDPAERERIQARMTHWASLSPQQRSQMRLRYQEARQVAPKSRQDRWTAYQALPIEERERLAASGSHAPRAASAASASDHPRARTPSGVVVTRKIIAPAVVQAQPGATTTLMSRKTTPPLHVQAGMPRIAASPTLVDSVTLLPKKRPPSPPIPTISPTPPTPPTPPFQSMPSFAGFMTDRSEARAVGLSALAGLTPSLGRRMACFLYEGVLLFGVLMMAGYLFSSLTQQRNAMVGRHALEGFLFVVLGIYFAWFWSRAGQTVAMKAWHVRLQAADGGPVSQARAFCRYLLCYLWFLPGLALPWFLHSRTVGGIFGWLIGWIAAYAFLSRFMLQRQFAHDIVAGTRLVMAPMVPRTRGAVVN